MLHGRFLYFRTHLSETNTYIIILAITFIIIYLYSKTVRKLGKQSDFFAGGCPATTDSRYLHRTSHHHNNNILPFYARAAAVCSFFFRISYTYLLYKNMLGMHTIFCLLKGREDHDRLSSRSHHADRCWITIILTIYYYLSI